MIRRQILSGISQLLGLGLLESTASAQPATAKKLKILMRGSWGTDDPTRASFVFAHALALSDAGHDVQIFLTADATYLMRKATAAAVIPIGWPPLNEMREKIVAKRIPFFLEGPAPGPVGSRKTILKLGMRSSVVRPCSFPS